MNYRGLSKIRMAVLLVAVLGFVSLTLGEKAYVGFGADKVEATSKKDTKKSTKKATKKKTHATKKKVALTPKTVRDDKKMLALKKFTYNDPSEKKAYPDLTAHPDAWVDVDIATQRVYIKDGKKSLYEMYSSTGKKDTTPRGTYYIQNERGNYFYTQPLKLGAYYYVSFLNHGEYLFHTTPTDDKGKYVESIAKTLGREPSSHGCVHLSVPDCKWFYDNVPSGMKVVIHGKYQS